MMLTNLLFMFGIISLAMWIYQTTILPSIRQRLRFELFHLRDKTRQLVIEGKLKEDSAIFYHLHRQINVLIKAIPALDIAFVSAIEYDKPELQERANRFQDLIKDSIPEAQEIHNRVITVLAYTLLANSFFGVLVIGLGAVLPVLVSQGIWKLCGIMFERVKQAVIPVSEIRDDQLSILPSAA